jgi:hypothetical protein
LERGSLAAGGQWPGAAAGGEALEEKKTVSGIISTGFCGALDPALQSGGYHQQFLATSCPPIASPLRARRSATCTAKTGAAAVEMEAAAVARKAEGVGRPVSLHARGVRYRQDDLPLDFNLYRDADGTFFADPHCAWAALGRPFTRVPALLRLDRNCRIAAESLGDFFADCRF